VVTRPLGEPVRTTTDWLGGVERLGQDGHLVGERIEQLDPLALNWNVHGRRR
jgi:hypothetical protein